MKVEILRNPLRKGYAAQLGRNTDGKQYKLGYVCYCLHENLVKRTCSENSDTFFEKEI